MGFEPFTPPAPKTETRLDKVQSLAKLLYERGLTSSMADARRLAEGMVEGEKKVVQDVHRWEKSKSDAPEPQEHHHPKSTLSLALPQDFAHFVAQAAVMSHDQHETTVAPAVTHTQIFFAEAPPITTITKGDAGIAIKTVTATPQEVVVEEKVIVEVEPEEVPAPLHAEPVRETIPLAPREEQVEIKSVPAAPAQEHALAKQHGVDLFEMFKKKA
jgi:hypothetical protein